MVGSWCFGICRSLILKISWHRHWPRCYTCRCCALPRHQAGIGWTPSRSFCSPVSDIGYRIADSGYRTLKSDIGYQISDIRYWTSDFRYRILVLLFTSSVFNSAKAFLFTSTGFTSALVSRSLPTSPDWRLDGCTCAWERFWVTLKNIHPSIRKNQSLMIRILWGWCHQWWEIWYLLNDGGEPGQDKLCGWSPVNARLWGWCRRHKQDFHFEIVEFPIWCFFTFSPTEASVQPRLDPQHGLQPGGKKIKVLTFSSRDGRLARWCWY